MYLLNFIYYFLYIYIGLFLLTSLMLLCNCMDEKIIIIFSEVCKKNRTYGSAVRMKF